MDEWRDQIRGIFAAKHQLSDDAGQDLVLPWKEGKPLRRNDFLVSKGVVETNLYYIRAGTLRIYYPYQDEEICVGFAYDGNLICSFPSFIKQKPSDYFIQALSQVELSVVSKIEFDLLLDRHRELERAWRMLEEDALVGKIERETEMLTYSPEERYSRLLQRSPHIFQKVPRKYIASYLRMTPETLSRVSAR